MDIEFTSINHSYNDDLRVVIFQKNAAAPEELPVAWTVIEHSREGWPCKFWYPIDLYADAEDSWGNVSDMHPAASGQKWKVVKDASGCQMVLDSEPTKDPGLIEIKNALPARTVSAKVYRGGKFLAIKTGLGPGQSASFEFGPLLYIGVVPQIQEGDVINSAILADIKTEISLLGITKASIFITGGGVGKSARPFEFTLVPTA